MGISKQKWTSEEEEALRAGVAKHGKGKWKSILEDPQFSCLLFVRSNIDLKDKWRNMSNVRGQGFTETSKARKLKDNALSIARGKRSEDTLKFETNLTSEALAAPLPKPEAKASSTRTTAGVIPKFSLKCLSDGRTAQAPIMLKNTMIFEALANLKESSGSNSSSIATYIQQRHEVPHQFRQRLGARLRSLVAKKRLEKVQNCYRLTRGFLPVAQRKKQTEKVAAAVNETLPPFKASEEYERTRAKPIKQKEKVAAAVNKAFPAVKPGKEAERLRISPMKQEKVTAAVNKAFPGAKAGKEAKRLRASPIKQKEQVAAAVNKTFLDAHAGKEAKRLRASPMKQEKVAVKKTFSVSKAGKRAKRQRASPMKQKENQTQTMGRTETKLAVSAANEVAAANNKIVRAFKDGKEAERLRVFPIKQKKRKSKAKERSEEELAADAAFYVAAVEHKTRLASEAAKEAERVSKLVEEANSMLQFANEVLEKCSRGETVRLN